MQQLLALQLTWLSCFNSLGSGASVCPPAVLQHILLQHIGMSCCGTSARPAAVYQHVLLQSVCLSYHGLSMSGCGSSASHAAALRLAAALQLAWSRSFSSPSCIFDYQLCFAAPALGFVGLPVQHGDSGLLAS